MRSDSKIVRVGFSLLEVLAIVTVLGIIAAIVVPRLTNSDQSAAQKRNELNKAMINAAVERWYIEKNTWPASDLSDISEDVKYFPDGVPSNPVDGSYYSLNPTTHRVN